MVLMGKIILTRPLDSDIRFFGYDGADCTYLWIRLHPGAAGQIDKRVSGG